MERRSFLTGAAAASLPLLKPQRVLGANDRLQIGFIGVGGRAKWLLRNERFPGAEVVAVADCFEPRLGEAAALLPDPSRVKRYPDHRSLLDGEKLDAVFVETTTHARAYVMLQAMQAGLDVYGEKPLTLTVEEGRAVSEASMKLDRILQTGTQQRSIPINAWTSQQIREGVIGKVKEVIVCNFLPPDGWYPRPAQKMPAGLNWDLWSNQCEVRPYHPELHYRWAWYWDYDAGGMSWGVSGWGTHSLDQVQCALGTDDTGPVMIEPENWRRNAKVTMRYANGTVVKMIGPKRDHADLGAIFVGEKGTIEIKRGTVTADPPDLLKGGPDITPEGPGENRWHIANFLECVRSRRQPAANAEVGHRSTTMCNLMNFCRDLGRTLEWDPKAERFVGDEQANSLLSRPRRPGFELPRV